MKKKICFIISSPLTAQFFLEKHFEILAEEFEVYLVANFGKDVSKRYSNPHLKAIHHIEIQREINLLKDFKALTDLSGYLKDQAFDAVLSVTPKAGLIGIMASRLAGIPNRIHIFTGQVWHTKKGIFKRFLMMLDKLIVWGSTKILVDGQSQRQFLVENGIINNSNSAVLGKGSISGVNLDRFYPKPELRKKIRMEMGYQHDDVVFMNLGRTNWEKGIIELTEAFKLLSEKYPKAKLLYVGFDEDGLVPKIKEILGNSPAFHYYGSTPKPEELLQVCDVFCLPSHREGFGTSVIEASLLGVPVICSDTYGLMETMVDDETGLRHPVKDTQAIFACMERLMVDNNLREKLGSQGMQYVKTHFPAIVISKAWLKFFEELLQK